MPTGLERPGGTSSGLPPALLTGEIEQKPTSRAPGAAGLLLFDFACSHQGTTALLAVLVGAPESAPPERSIPRRHLESIIWMRSFPRWSGQPVAAAGPRPGTDRQPGRERG